MEEEDNIKVLTGTAQNGRFINALDSNYVKLDERSFEDLLVFSYGLSKLINFYNLENRVDGDWSHFFSDETIILATIIDSDPSKIEKGFKGHIFKYMTFNKLEKKLDYLNRCFKEIYSIAHKFETWLVKLKAVEDYTHIPVGIRNEIYNAVTSKLSPALLRLKQLDEAAKDAIGQRPGLDFDAFGEIWKLDSELAADENLYKGASTKEKIDSISPLLQNIFQAFYETLLYLKKKSPEYMKQSLQTDAHYPEIGLFISFLQLFKHNQDHLNKLTRKHLEFYFSSILKQKKREPMKDKVYLKFILNDNALFSKIEQGTKFLGGEDVDGTNIIYTADETLQVNKVIVKKLQNVFVDKKSFNVKGIEKKVVSNIHSSEIPLYMPTPANLGSKYNKTYAAFGETQAGRGINDKSMSDADIGFAISSPGLILREGKREITLRFLFSKESFDYLQYHLNDLTIISNETFEEVFIKLFLDAFKLTITVDKAWYEIKRYVITQDLEQNSLVLKFDLDGSEPAIASYNKQFHKGTYKAIFPVLKFILNNNSYLYAYSFLNSLNLEQVIIESSVKGVKNLQLFSNIGQLSPNTPFYPFGTMPVPGTYFIIGSSEIFNKSLDKLKINIEWFDLPKHKSGFFGHYEEYNLGIDNSQFEAKLSILDSGRWIPESKKEQQVFKLFRSEDEDPTADPKPKSALSSETVIDNINITPIKQSSDYLSLNQNLTYSTTTKRGFIRLELSQPANGFAHNVYPSVLSQITIENSKSGFFKNNKTRPLPNPPYTPLIQNISLDYASTSVINLSDRSSKNDILKGQVYHIHPFGENIVYPDTTKIVTKLFPDYDYEGCLLFGFTNLNPPQTVSIFVEMIDEFTVSSEDDPPVIEWKYLKNDEWFTLKPTKVLRDDTNGFLKTGIIIIELPSDIEKDNATLDADKFWLRAAVIKNIEVASRIVNVYTQVITATLSSETNLYGSHLEKPLAAFSITRSVSNTEGIQSVIQPLDSFEGNPAEKDLDFFVRVGERLRHKDRAIMPWDFEHIILDNFPEIYKATCLPNMTSTNLDAPGSVLIVVTPNIQKAVNPNEPLASSELLYKIKNHLQGVTSPFVRLEVRNPTYERIKIICAVKFTSGYNYGYFIQKLNEQINDYLSGKISSNFNGFDLGGVVNSSDILTFMRTLPYVDFITKFSMIQTAKDFKGQYVLLDTARDGEEKASLRATKPWSVLVPAEEHQITVLVDKLEQHSLQAGIDYLELGNDFIIDK